jgi:hypothetical protein
MDVGIVHPFGRLKKGHRLRIDFDHVHGVSVPLNQRLGQGTCSWTDFEDLMA